MNSKRGFTLIELLIVAGVLTLLSAVAVPNFLEAQTRAKVSAARGNLRTVKIGLETFAVDNNSYPATKAHSYHDPLAILARVQLQPLTTPIAYVSPDAFIDPFGLIQPHLFASSGVRRNGGSYYGGDSVNPNRSLVYFHYPSLARSFNDQRCYIAGAGIVSIGPDLQDSLGAYLPFSQATFTGKFGFSQLAHPIDTIYDPTNGTMSAGDIAAFVGGAARLDAH